MRDDGQRIINGGLQIKVLPKLLVDDCHYALHKAHYKLENVDMEHREQARQVLELITCQNPEGMKNYSAKFRSYNQLLMINELIQKLRDKDGPHSIRLVRHPDDYYSNTYEVRLNADFCERKNVKEGSIMILEPNNQNQQQAEQFRGEVIFYDKSTQIVEFTQSEFDHPKVLEYIRTKYMVRIEPNRFAYNARNHILQHMVTFQNDLNFLLFPKPFDESLTIEEYVKQRENGMTKLDFSTAVPFNGEQREAIYAITMAQEVRVQNQEGGLLPYIIHGAPGTGKTTSLVEACRMLLAKRDPLDRILVCAPSDAAADKFAIELLNTGEGKKAAIFRLYELTKPVDELPEALKCVSLVCKNEDGIEMFGICPLSELLKKKVIICTLLASTYLALGGLCKQISHLIIDDAGEATEMDCLVPIVGLMGRITKVILAGQDCPRGALEKIEFFKNCNISQSMIARYKELDFIRDDPRTMIMLHTNYGSHLPSAVSGPTNLI